ncbi:MAG: Hsp20/alpha crystallin family protein [Betaproteobacteria bacterium]|nr:Hsp20/alpha crystallin family protein [Betaproteobacteria bacterium]
MSEQNGARTGGESAAEQAALLPPVDVIEDQGGITLYADVPGVSREHLQLHVEGDNLFLDGQIAVEMPKDMEATHVEVPRSRYRRVFALSREFDTGRLTADLKNGVLRLRIPKAEHAKPKRIQISTE